MDARVKSDRTIRNFDRYVDERLDDGVFRVHLDTFRDPELFDLEMEYIFEKTWVFVGHESQIPELNDFITTQIGRHPVIMQRGADDQIRVFLNHCTHRGPRLCKTQRGNASRHVCPYHGWMFDSQGNCTMVTDEEQGGYSEAFRNMSHDLYQVARLESHRGFYWASLVDDVPPLSEYLGDIRFFIDAWIDQSPEGLEWVKGDANFTYDGNWKMVFENCLDLYHAKTLHASFGNAVMNRFKNMGEDERKSINLDDFVNATANVSYYNFDHGHGALWIQNQSKPEDRPSYAMYQEIEKRLGKEKAELILSGKVAAVFPSILFVESATFQMRMIRPISVDKTEIYAFCLAPKGEPAAARALRVRQYEDFFSASGLATPDDTAVYRAAQEGDQAYILEWNQGYHRGMEMIQQGADERAKSIGFNPTLSIHGSISIQGEAMYIGPYREWLKKMKAGQDAALSTGEKR
ncbi:MAG TPA: benzoate 1,2-dioxygenase large subunit [Gammaproteobacteria bacterium]|nr:benzoate 1,2-dioxygenase large subunit [Gammaproteobacteria bacterium]